MTFFVVGGVVAMMISFDRQWFYAIFLLWLGFILTCLGITFELSLILLAYAIKRTTILSPAVSHSLLMRGIAVFLVTAISVGFDLLISLDQLKNQTSPYEQTTTSGFDWRNYGFLWFQYGLVVLGLWYSW